MGQVHAFEYTLYLAYPSKRFVRAHEALHKFAEDVGFVGYTILYGLGVWGGKQEQCLILKSQCAGIDRAVLQWAVDRLCAATDQRAVQFVTRDVLAETIYAERKDA